MKKNIITNKENNTITVEISVNKRNYVREPIISFRTKDIILLLEKEGFEIGACIKSDKIYNDGRGAKLTGEWTFKIKQKLKEKAKKPVVKKNSTIKNLTKESKSAIVSKKTKNERR